MQTIKLYEAIKAGDLPEISRLSRGEKMLKKCPFCGSEAAHGRVNYSRAVVKEQKWDQDEHYFINCIVCGVNNQGLVGHRTPEKAADCWNTRIGETP